MDIKLKSLMKFVGVCIGSLLISNLPVFTKTSYAAINLKLAFAGSPRTFSAQAHKWWAEEVERRTDGKVKIRLYWGGSLANHREMVQLVGSGAIEMGESSWAPYNPKVFPLHTITDGPVTWRRKPLALIHAGMDLEKNIPEVGAENKKANLKRLTWQGPGVSALMLKKKDVQTVEDLNGLQIRVVGRYLQPPMYKAVGAVSIGVPFPEIYDAMQKGILDGATGTLGLFAGIKLHEVCDYYLEIGMGGDSGHGIMMNLDKYNKLPQDIKDVLVKLFEEDFTQVFYEEFAMPEYQKAISVFKEAGVKSSILSDAEVAKWQALHPQEEHIKPWIEATAKVSGLSESRVREILNEYVRLIDHYETLYPQKW